MTALPRPCLDCGDLASSSRCEPCAEVHDREQQRVEDETRGSATARGYDAAWQRLSTEARRKQPWCSDCGHWGNAANPLTADHLPGAWEKRAAGKALTLLDVEVVCRDCNTKRGAARGQHVTRPGGGPPTPSGGRTRRGSPEAGYSSAAQVPS